MEILKLCNRQSSNESKHIYKNKIVTMMTKLTIVVNVRLKNSAFCWELFILINLKGFSKFI